MPDNECPFCGATYKYFRMVRCDSGLNKTARFNIVNISSGDILGYISWYTAWRQYCFMTNGVTVWSAGCLRDVQTFLDEINAAHKANLKERKADMATACQAASGFF